MNKKRGNLKNPLFLRFNMCYNITEILKLYYNLIKTLDNKQKKNKILVYIRKAEIGDEDN